MTLLLTGCSRKPTNVHQHWLHILSPRLLTSRKQGPATGSGGPQNPSSIRGSAAHRAVTIAAASRAFLLTPLLTFFAVSSLGGDRS